MATKDETAAIICSFCAVITTFDQQDRIYAQGFTLSVRTPIDHGLKLTYTKSSFTVV